MKKISKILVILLINIVCILANSGVSYGENQNLPSLQTLISNLGTDVEEKINNSNSDSQVLINGDTGVRYQSNFYEVMANNSILSKDDTYTYCISRGIGNLGQAGGDKGYYNMQLCIIISKEGIFYNSASAHNASHYNSSQLDKISWEEAKEDYGDQFVAAAKKMYYILKADKKYGTNHNADTADSSHRLWVDCYTPYKKADGSPLVLTVKATERQYAIWMTINPLLDYDGFIFRGTGALEYNKKGQILFGGSCDLLSETEEAYKNNKIKIDEPVYMWILQAPEGTEEGLYQDILVGGTRDKTITNKGSITVNKVDSTTNKPISSNVKFSLCKYENGRYEHISTKSIVNGSVTFSNLDLGIKYAVFEYENTNTGYDLSNQGMEFKTFYGKDTSGNYNSWSKPFCFEKYLSQEDFSSTWTVPNKKSEPPKGSITVNKVDSITNKPISSNVKFSLCKYENGRYEHISTRSIVNGSVTFSDLELGITYAVFEYENTNSGYNLNNQGLQFKTFYGMDTSGNYSSWSKPFCFEKYLSQDDFSSTWTVPNKKSEPPKGSITVKKVDSISGKIISSNVKFSLCKWVNGRYEHISTQSIDKGSVTFSNLELGIKYAVFEYENTNPGYDLDKQGIKYETFYGTNTSGNFDSWSRPLCFTKELTESYQTHTETVKNKQKGSIKIKKIDQDGKPISGISFDLIEGNYTGDGGTYTGKTGDKLYVGLDGKIKTGRTNGNGELTFDNLEIGSYTIRETWSIKESYKRNIGYKTTLITLTSTNRDNTYYYDNPIGNTDYGGLTLDAKVDKYTGKPLSGVGFKLYQGNAVKYTLGDTDGNGKTSSSSSIGRNSSITLKNAYGIEVDTMYTIVPGEYDLYEYKNPNEGYNIRFQGQYYVSGKGAYIGKVTISKGQITNIANLTYTYKNENTGKNETVKYNINEPFASIYLHKYIEELNSEGTLIRKPLAGAKFKLYQNDKVVKLKNTTDTGYTEEFESVLSEDGTDAKVTIERIPAGIYYVYEVQSFDKNGKELVDLTIQPGYDASKNAVKIAKVTISEAGEATVVLVSDTKQIMGTDNKQHYYRGYAIVKQTVTNGKGAETKVGLYITNRRYIQVSGYVWEDIGPDTKVPGNGNDKYKDSNTEKDKKISGMKVSLHKKGKNKALETVKTDNNGDYKFTTLIPSIELKNGEYFVKFQYSEYGARNIAEYSERKKYLYIPVNSIFDKTNGSKALTVEMLEEADNALFQNKEAVTGYADNGADNAITNIYNQFKQNKIKVSDWIKYDTGDSIPTLHYINLGIRQLIHPEFTIDQTIDHALLTVNGYKYKYIYGNDGDEKNYDPNDTARPTVRWQSETDISTYCLREIYPSDLPQNGVNTELQIVYKINITNNTDIDIASIYKENAMFIDSLTNTYDATRYTLIPETVIERVENNNKITEIYNWNGATIQKDSSNNRSQGTTTLNMAKTTTFNDGIKSKETKTVYIAFKVKNEALNDLLNNPNGIVEDFPTKAIASVYHEYTRYDYSWKDPKENKGEKQSSWHTWFNVEGRKHKSVVDTKEDAAPYLALKLHNPNEQRTISGIVFKDDKDENKYKTTGEVLGDGLFDDSENVISGVKVELLNKQDSTPAKRSVLKNKSLNEYEIQETTSEVTTEKGEYSFVGVVPGEYFVRFTYGNGTQRIVDTAGNEIENGIIYSNGYKSTIITPTTVKNMVKDERYNGLDMKLDQNLKNSIWYLNSEIERSNKAVDKNISFEYESQIDFRTKNATRDEYAQDRLAETPFISVQIEFNTSNEGIASYYNDKFSNMNFGIIEKPKVEMTIRKEITNIKLAYNNGQGLLNGNPTANIPYVSNLDEDWTDSGSRYVKIETKDSNIYGATLDVIYSITVENASDLTYTTEDYYKFGTKPKLNNSNTQIDESKEAKVYVNSVLEYLDPLLKIKRYSDIEENNGEEYTYNKDMDSKEIDINKTTANSSYKVARGTLAEKESSSDKEKNELISKYTKVYELGNNEEKQYKINNAELRTKKVSSEQSTTKLQVVATRLLSNENDDLDYISYAQLSTVTTARNAYSDPTAAPLVSAEVAANQPYGDIPEDSSTLTITPSTGLNKNMDYYIAGIILLSTLGAVVVCVKKIRK